MKTLLNLILSFLLFQNFVLCFDDDPAPRAEIFIANRSTTKDIYIKVIPIGFVFNGKKINGNPSIKDYRYSSEAFMPFSGENNHIFGGYKQLPRVSGSFIWGINAFNINMDLAAAQGSDCDSIIGIGKYKIEIWNVIDGDQFGDFIDSCYVDFSDWGLPYDPNITPYNNDIYINYYNDNDIKFSFTAQEIYIWDSHANRDLKIWYQIKSVSPSLIIHSITQNKGHELPLIL